ncbi:DMT family transporter [Stappia sp. F7233]|uniref:DMT family transporter n=1 Tax=Stappia albiluteola TaxID=2758565 RepID=A0A839ACJ9_9HYPH|nr:DMT family transporter [Stappia albiluteola]MBA5777373.1 DMT family transporter [Stappia albiluteola]
MSTDASELRDAGRPDAQAARNALTGIALMCAAVFCFAGLDATAKFLVRDLPAVQVVWMRFLTHVVLAMIIFRVWRDIAIFRSRHWGLHLIRSLCLLGSTVFNFLAVRYLQLAETVSIMFAAPFVVTALAGPILGEWAGLRRWLAIAVGFLGVLVVVRPGVGGMHWAAIYSVAAMGCYAFYALLTRKMAGTDSAAGMLIISGAVAALAMTPVAIDAWVMPKDASTWLLLLSTGAYGSIGHLALIQAHRLAPAPLLAPFMYTQIVWMVGLGYLVFNDVPGPWTFLGAAIVVSSGLYILYRERVTGRG